jgi:hypothetical protein
MISDLFQLAHRLVKLYPEEAISWYAVGCYYFVIGKKITFIHLRYLKSELN